ncbi:putative glycosyltransferase [Carnobacterium sp. AT7]|uniref:glycosyltransferase family 4 protein n=1 Tax=Carnobacterium sp. AT7 TaxID=333990 RepID=UPI00015F16E2|nr:glycosyltransferase [Carnobacterium sp. AT7]EDP68086.1 putative glycosyltransferase [Carnobacterium sp. AT7]
MKKYRVAMVFNIIPEVPAIVMGITPSPMGGWLMSMVNRIINSNLLNVDIISPADVDELKIIKKNNVNYFLIPSNNNTVFWQEYIDKFKPSIIHINGTEFTHTENLFETNFKGSIIVSLQGIVNEIYKNVYGSLDSKEILKNITIKDIIRKSSIFQIKKRFEKQSKYEMKLLNKADIIIGRTSWDKGFVRSIEKTDKYRVCNENLRDVFYTNEKWSIEKCQKYTIFCSQATMPYKGIDILFKALPIVKKYFPTVKVRISGFNPIRNESIKDKLLRSGYGKILLKLIKENNLEENVEFIGLIDAEGIHEQYLNSHIFVQSSMIENSPNSLGEALILGVPSVASDVGGTKDFINSGVNGFLYDSNDYMILATKILDIFQNEKLAQSFSENSVSFSEGRYDRNENAKALINIYEEILNIDIY